jgi:hypothetical protein
MRTSRLVRLFPARWRERYGSEFSALLEDLPASPQLVIDVFFSAIAARLAQARQRVVGGPLDLRGPNGSGLLALGVMVPSIVLVLAFGLKFKFGVAGPFDAISQPSQAIAVVHYFLVFAPWLSLALVSRALFRPSVRRSGASLTIQLETSADPVALAVAWVALLVLFVLMRYFVFQHSPVWGWSAWTVPWPWFAPPWDQR